MILKRNNDNMIWNTTNLTAYYVSIINGFTR